MRNVWTGVFGLVDENEMMQAFNMAHLLNKMDEMLTYAELEAVFLCSFILRWFVTALDERLARVLSMFLKPFLHIILLIVFLFLFQTNGSNWFFS